MVLCIYLGVTRYYFKNIVFLSLKMYIFRGNRLLCLNIEFLSLKLYIFRGNGLFFLKHCISISEDIYLGVTSYYF